MMDDRLQPRRTPGTPWSRTVGQRLPEDPPLAIAIAAPEPADLDTQVHGTTM